MAKKSDVWMPLYVTDYLGDTMHLSTEQHGAYLLLIMAAWKNGGSLPNDDRVLRRITRMEEKAWKESSIELKSFFFEQNGSIRHNRIETELKRAKRMTEQRAEAGKASAIKRSKQRNANEDCNENSTKCTTNETRNSRPSPSPNLPTVVIGKPPCQESKYSGKVDTETGEVVWAN